MAPSTMRRIPVAVACALVAAVVLIGCGADDTSGSGDGSGQDTETVTLVGEDIAFDRGRLAVPAGVEVTIVFENRDTVAHNLRVFGPNEEYATEIARGPVTQELTFTIDEPGEYRFQCDVHPAQMSGTLVVTSA